MKLSKFNKSTLYECVREFIKEKIIGGGVVDVCHNNPESIEVVKNDSLETKKRCFNIISK